QNFIWLKPQLFQCSLEHKRMRFVGPHGFGDEDELDGQCEVPGSEVFMIGVGNNGGAYVPERAQHLERFWVELYLPRHLKDKIDIRGRISAHTKPSQDARQNLSLNCSERPDRR